MPVARLQNDLLRDGATAQKQAALAPHPVQTIQANVRGARHAADGKQETHGSCVPGVAALPAATPTHPAHPLQHFKNTWDADQFLLTQVYGATAAWERRMERSVLSQVQRLPGVPSAHVGLDHMLGRDDKVRGEASVWGWGARLHEGCTRDAALPLEGKRLG